MAMVVSSPITILILLFAVGLVVSAPVNITLTGEFIDHGEPNLICTRSTPASILLFLFANYVAHAATIKSHPGESTMSSSIGTVLALCFPGSGLFRALNSLVRHARFSKGTELQKAARAGALCVVVRSEEWTPRPGDVIHHATLHKKQSLRDGQQRSKINPGYSYSIRKPNSLKEPLPCLDLYVSHFRDRQVHGSWFLPEGYEFEIIPSSMKVEPRTNVDASVICHDVASIYNISKTILAVVQTAFAAFTLYRARGNQIELYGYAAFGLTVTPYVIMSIVNLLGQVATPDFPRTYMVRSLEMEEAERRGGSFDGTVGAVIPDTTKSNKTLCRVDFAAHDQHQVLEATIIPQRRVDSVAMTASTSSEASQTLMLEEITNNRPDEVQPATSARKLLLNTNNRIQWTALIGEKNRRPAYLVVPSLSNYDKIPVERSYGFFARFLFYSSATLFLGLISLIIIGTLSRFAEGTSSSQAQRGWIMAWLVLGMVSGVFSQHIGFFASVCYAMTRKTLADEGWSKSAMMSILPTLTMIILCPGVFFVPAIGGFVVVVQQLIQYGDCTRIKG